MLQRISIFGFGVACYAVFLATFLYAIGFVGNLVVPKGIDSGPEVPLTEALLMNAGLLTLFAVQHSVMARKWFKERVTRLIPAGVERSTYVLLSSICLIALFLFWQPVGGTVWNVTDPMLKAVLYGFFGFGWALVLVATFLINHFDLFGLRQVTLQLLGRPYTPVQFKLPAVYTVTRHPLYLGFIIAFWATPVMTVAHLVFAIATTAYVIVAIKLEEKDLVAEYGTRYEHYRTAVPMLVPTFARRAVELKDLANRYTLELRVGAEKSASRSMEE